MITYQFPVVKFNDPDDSEDSEIVMHDGKIKPIRIQQEPYEADIEALGSRFHLIFGSHRSGGFLCIPDWQIGCEIASYDDVFWNQESLTSLDEKISYEECTALVYALKKLSEYI